MIRSKEEALRILGLAGEAGPDDWKSAYRAICKKYHPDSFRAMDISEDDARAYERYYLMAVEAYEFLENNKTSDVSLSDLNSAGDNTYASYRKPRVVGAPVSFRNSEQASREKKAREKLERDSQERKKKRLEEIREEGRKLSSNKKEEEILEKIRWIRVAEIIRKTIEADKIKKDSE